MTELLSSLFSQIVLMLVALVASAGSDAVAVRHPMLGAPVTAEIAAADPNERVDRCAANRPAPDDACEAAARMRWQVTLHLPSARRCTSDCAG